MSSVRSAAYLAGGVAVAVVAGVLAARGDWVLAFVAGSGLAIIAAGLCRARSGPAPSRKERPEPPSIDNRLGEMARALDQAPFGLAILDDAGHITDSNAAFRDLLRDREPHGKALLTFIAEEDVEGLEARLRELGQPGIEAVPPVDVQLAQPETRDTPSALTIYPRRAEPTDSGDGGGIIIHAVDATERRRLETQFAQSQKMQAVGQLAGGISHDFNNLLTGIIGFCDLLLQRHQPGEASFGDAMQIKHSANRAAGLTRQLLAFSRQQSLEARPIDLTDVLAELSHLLRRLLGEMVVLNVLHGRDLWPVRADPGKIEQMVINLAVNARDAMPGGGTLSIQTDNFTARKSYTVRGETLPPGDYVCLAVSDSGIGMTEETLNRIFEPFFTTKDVGEGTGLGLAMVYGSVKQMGGRVFAQSDGPDKGTRITLYFPRSMEQVEERQSDSAGEAAPGDMTGEGKVLLVEDEDAVRLFSARALRAKGYHVTEARTGEAALDILADQKFDVLITDMMMPKVDGATVIREARRRQSHLPVVCISGYTRESIARETDGISNLRFLAKPFSLKQLAAAVKAAIESDGA